MKIAKPSTPPFIRPCKIDCWFPLTIGKFLRAGMQAVFLGLFFSLKRYCKSGFCYRSCEGQKIYHKGLKILHHSLFRLINVNIFVNEQPERFHWAHWGWPFYTYCTSHTRFRSWSFYRSR